MLSPHWYKSLFFLILLGLCTVVARPQRSLRVVSWNVENLFDTQHDEGTDDFEFLPQSQRHWNTGRLRRKLTEMARVIAAISEDGGQPDIIGLCEVENDSVLTALTRRSPLSTLRYDYVMTHSADQRGIDVALLYQPDRFHLLTSQSIVVPSLQHGFRPTRDILYVKGLVPAEEGRDTLHVFVVHLPSRTGGVSGDKNRLLAAKTLSHAVDSICERAHQATEETAGLQPHILVMGDFNTDHRDPLFKDISLRLTDDLQQPGTYCFRAFWQWLDHILVSSSIETRGPARAFSLPWLLEEDNFGTLMPRRTYRGTTYNGGISDHLPVVLDVILQ